MLLKAADSSIISLKDESKFLATASDYTIGFTSWIEPRHAHLMDSCVIIKAPGIKAIDVVSTLISQERNGQITICVTEVVVIDAMQGLISERAGVFWGVCKGFDE